MRDRTRSSVPYGPGKDVGVVSSSSLTSIIFLGANVLFLLPPHHTNQRTPTNSRICLRTILTNLLPPPNSRCKEALADLDPLLHIEAARGLHIERSFSARSIHLYPHMLTIFDEKRDESVMREDRDQHH